LQFFVIGDEDTVLGFSLTGIDGVVARDAESARQALEEALEREDLGIIIFTERTAALIRPEINAHIYNTTHPLIVEIPDRLGPVADRISIKEVIQTAVGIRME
jgi:V/A-type H+-transporting ATPase subunit F